MWRGKKSVKNNDFITIHDYNDYYYYYCNQGGVGEGEGDGVVYASM